MASQAPQPFHPEIPGVNPLFTVTNKIFDCGITDGVLFNCDKKSDRKASELFDDAFLSYMEKTYEEFDKDIESSSNIKVVNEKIRLGPRQKKNIKDFI